MKHLSKAVVFASVLVILSCAKKEAPATIDSAQHTDTTAVAKEGQGLGVVKGVDTSMTSVVLDHNTIPGIMEAMAMEYPVAKKELLNGITRGDSVRFTLRSPKDGEYVVTSITKIAAK